MRHTHLVGLLWKSDHLVAETANVTQQTQETTIHVLSEIRTGDPSIRATADLRDRPHGHRYQPSFVTSKELTIANLTLQDTVLWASKLFNFWNVYICIVVWGVKIFCFQIGLYVMGVSYYTHLCQKKFRTWNTHVWTSPDLPGLVSRDFYVLLTQTVYLKTFSEIWLQYRCFRKLLPAVFASMTEILKWVFRIINRPL